MSIKLDKINRVRIMPVSKVEMGFCFYLESPAQKLSPGDPKREQNMTNTQYHLIREADRILAKAGLNKVAQPKRSYKSEDAMVKAVSTPCGGQPGWKR